MIIDEYLSGRKLYGDDFNMDQIEEWFADEAEAYANLGAADRSSYQFRHHALNKELGYKYLNKPIRHVLSFGGAYGDELLPIASKIEAITIVEPSDALRSEHVEGIPVRYVKPEIRELPFEDGAFDLVTCMGVLHHVPNVSDTIREFYRVLEPGGVALIREPIVSMGDWRYPRNRLTKRERGIPRPLLRDMVRDSGFTIRKETLCGFPPVRRAASLFGKSAFNSTPAVKLDILMARLFQWNYRYHAQGTIKKLRPTLAFLVLTK